MKRLSLAVFFIIVMVSSVNAQSTLVLQEKCSTAAKALFASIDKPSNTETLGLWFWSFECHYNKKMDKCFILLQGTCYEKDGSGQNVALVNVFEEKELASYMCKYDKAGVLEWRWCHLGDTQFNVLNGFEFNNKTKEWDIISQAYTNSLKNPFSDPMKEKYEKWVKPYMEE
jgi:hypothetical protein